MREEFDVVVAGAGHNSLVTAAYLSMAGLRCLVLEARRQIGGDTSSEELTLPGFLHDSCSTAHNLIQASPLIRDNELHLDEYGLEYLYPDPVVHIPFPDGASITMHRDLDSTCEELARFSRRDADAYRSLIRDYEEVAPVFGRYRNSPAGWGDSLEEALTVHPGGGGWRRRMAMSAWEVIGHLFEESHVRAFLLWMAFMTVQPVDRPNTGLLAYSLAFGRQRHSWTLPRGGSGALPMALCRLIDDRGGTVLTGRKVSALILEDGRCVGVETDDGDRYLAGRAVLSTIHVKHLVEMAPADAWGEDFLFGVETWQPGVSMFVTHYATTEPPVFRADQGLVTSVAAGTPGSVERMLRVGADFAAARVATEDPVLLVVCPTVADPSRAPDGKHTLKVIGFQPYRLPEGPDHWDEIKARVSEANLEQLRRYAPNLTEATILERVVKSPLDLERFNAHNWHGSCHGGDMGPAQSGALRPAPGWAQHRTPIEGLYQTGATTHPGGSVSAAPGRNAAMVMLADFGTSLQEVIAGA
jgi:phytoene dehydrogenase-like protein